MFNGMMMDPELMRMAQEQMSRMSPAELARIQQQMMSNPELMKMASESMQNLRPEDLKLAAEQLKHTCPEEIAEIGKKMTSASPEELAALRTQMDAQVAYQINAADMLKKQGNEFHSQGKYTSALEKYIRSKNNLKGVSTSKGRNILLACSLNMMSCYLKTKQFDECIKEGTELLAHDAKNVKALYRRGQAYKELGLLEDAVFDLRKASSVSPDDETIAGVLRDAEERLIKGGGNHSRGLIIEEITEETTVPSNNHENLTSSYNASARPESSQCSTNQTASHRKSPSTDTDYVGALKNDPEALRSFQDLMSRADPEAISAVSGGQVDGVSPDMLKTASSVITKMPPEELQRMFQLASSLQEEKSFSSSLSFSHGSIPSGLSPDMLKMASDMMSKMSQEDLEMMFEMTSSLKGSEAASSASRDSHSNFGSGAPNVTPDMLNLANDMMSKMSPEERQKIFETASSLRGQESVPSTAASRSSGLRSDDLRIQENSEVNGGNLRKKSSFVNLNSGSPSNVLNSPVDLQEQMRNQLKDPAMRQMLTSMMQNMSPEMMSNMSEQFGFKLSREEAEKAQQAMSSLSPEALDKMMKWADRVQRGVDGAKKTKNWLLGRSGMMLAIFMLLLAVIFHWFGFVGQ